MKTIKTYRDLFVWQKAIQLVILTYEATKSYPSDEKYGLTIQVKRAVVSIPSNIAEGFGRRSTADYIRFLHIAIASLYELQTQMEISKHLKFISDKNYTTIITMSRELEKMLSSLINKIPLKGK